MSNPAATRQTSDASPLVTVVIPVRNGDRFLSEAIESVLGQTYERRELVVVDGGSIDRSREIARSYDGVRVLSQRGRGVADAYNVGLEAAGGELIGFLGSDDRWSPGKLTAQVEYLHTHARTEATITLFEYFLEPESASPAGFRPGLLGRPLVGKLMETLLARRSVFDAVGPFDDDLRTSEDVDWFARAEDRGVRIDPIDAVLVHKRVHGGSTSLDPGRDEPYRDLFRALRKSVRRKRGGALAPSSAPGGAP